MITHNVEDGCFETPGGAVLTYRVEGARMIIDHTEVPSALRGQGLAAQLAEAALAHARSRNWKVVPQCSYIDTYMHRHTQHRDLLAE